ncbi:hypothetical protein VHUM_03307 [Vanrija humicola]|uniref:BolA protein n=1 Tax=Vanrija humicola TaxID=5417 RepID=A0A7D8UZZ6_VANHU|nr:hypothetical protein VHUM_03307 [Vanrija humicola]
MSLRLLAPLARATRASSSVSARRAYSIPAREQPTGLGEGERVIWDKLAARFPGTQLQVQDVSGGCGSFYAISVSSPEFKGLSMVKQHKLVNDCLKEDIKGIHGLQLKTIPEDAA